MVVPSQRKKSHPPYMIIEKAANTALTERNLETKFKVRISAYGVTRLEMR
jgi:hypothetical protein